MAARMRMGAPRHGRGRFKQRLGIATITGLLLLAVPACGDGRTAEEREHDETVALIEQSYSGALRDLRPSYVVMTYPASYAELAPEKQLELGIITGVLKAQNIPHTHGRRGDFLEQMTIPAKHRRTEEIDVFRVPAEIIASCSGGKVVFLNLGVEENLSTLKHPEAKDAGIDVLVWNDPVAVTTRMVPRY